MSVEINWAALTSGSQGDELSETIRLFIHDRFQQIQLPRFIRSVQVHKFAFGDVAPEVVVMDVCDPLPDFYAGDGDDDDDDDGDEDEEDGDDEDEEGGVDGGGETRGASEKSVDGVDGSINEVRRGLDDDDVDYDDTQAGAADSSARHRHPRTSGVSNATRRDTSRHEAENGTLNRKAVGSASTHNARSATTATSNNNNRPKPLTAENIGHSFFSNSLLHQSAAIPGGTSNMTHFHLPYGTPFSGPTTPLAAMAGGHFGAWPDIHPQLRGVQQQHARGSHRRRSASINSITPPSSTDPGSRPPSQHRQDSFGEIDSIDSVRFDGLSAHSEQNIKDQDPNDIQIVAHVKYSGNMKLNVTAELSLDYPMSSFVGIPLQLQITGFSFDGVAIVAHVNSKVFTCFLSPEDAQTFLGPSYTDEKKEPSASEATGALLEEIRVESEIGQKDGGKQVLKNVGKVERFVLEQVRRIFEDEFVFPSFWTFLL